MAELNQLTSQDTCLCWLPITHNLGLMGHMVAFALNMDLFSYETADAIKKPERLMKMLSQSKATFSQAPNFWFEHVLKNVNINNLYDCDFRQLRTILCGGEPINYKMAAAFIEKYVKFGMPCTVISSAYGLAETVAVATALPPDEQMVCQYIDRRFLNICDNVRVVEWDNEHAGEFVSVGQVDSHLEIAIKDQEGNTLTDGTVGVVHFKGSFVTKGYYNRPNLLKESLTQDGWLNTGDIGYMKEGRLTIVGRIKDVIFVNGQNFYSHDLEAAALAVDGIELREVVITTVAHDMGKEEITAFILDKNYEDVVKANIIQQLQLTINREFGISIAKTAFVDEIPKTVSGKLQRSILVKRYTEGDIKCFDSRYHAVKTSKTDNSSEILEELRSIFSVHIGSLENDMNFFDAGMTSLTLAIAVDKINEKVDSSITTIDLFAYPNINMLTDRIKNKPEEKAKVTKNDADFSVNIAIIGLSIELPGMEEPDAFWDALFNKTELVAELSDKRKMDVTEALNSANKVDRQYEFIRASYLENVDFFDNKYFRINPNEALSMSPQQRIFLQTAFKAVENAGYDITGMSGSRMGVYVGHIGDLEAYKYHTFVEASKGKNTPTGSLSSNIAGRVSFLLDLNGPCAMVDCACSSSLMALHTAIQAIKCGDCDSAIVGGVRILMNPSKEAEKIGIESSDYITRPFDAKSSGTGDGEGAVCIVIKKLEQALIDNDHIYCTIQGSACNQDGNSISISSPNMKAQERLIESVYKRAGINPESLGYLEAHGTGTVLGDPIEVKALSNAFSAFTTNKQFCSLGSVKGNIGHLYDASGLASVIKCCMMLDKRWILPLKNFESPNPKINFAETPFFVDTESREWESENEKRRCGISNFGFSGTNLHIILEEYIGRNNESEKKEGHVFAVSAKSQVSLIEMLKKAGKYIETHTVNISELCYSYGRKASYKYRFAVFVKDMEELQKRIEEALDGEKSGFGEQKIVIRAKELNKNSGELYQEDEAELSEIGRKLIMMLNEDADQERILKRLVRLYLDGGNISWDKQYSKKPNYISVPGYSFEKKRFWPSYN